jgi:hypothetical protein
MNEAPKSYHRSARTRNKNGRAKASGPSLGQESDVRIQTAANVNGPASAEMRVGDFRQITGTGFSMAGAYAKKESGILDNIDLPQRQVTTKDLPAIP